MKIEVGYGSGRSGSSYAIGREAAEKALATIHHHPVSAVIVYSSVRFDLKEVLSGIQSMTGDAPVLGTTTAGEICNELLSESVVVAALASSYLKVKCGVGRGVSHDWRGALDQTLNSASIKPFFDGSVSAWQDMTRQGKTVFAMFFSPGNTRQAGSRSYEILETLKQ